MSDFKKKIRPTDPIFGHVSESNRFFRPQIREELERWTLRVKVLLCIVRATVPSTAVRTTAV